MQRVTSHSQFGTPEEARVHSLTHSVTHTHADNEFMQAFLLTYRSFTNAHDLIHLLANRCFSPPSLCKGQLQAVPAEDGTIKPDKDWNEAEYEMYFMQFLTDFLHPVRLRYVDPGKCHSYSCNCERVCQVLKEWLLKYFADFASDPFLQTLLVHFLSLMADCQIKASADLLKVFQKQLSTFFPDDEKPYEHISVLEEIFAQKEQQQQQQPSLERVDSNFLSKIGNRFHIRHGSFSTTQFQITNTQIPKPILPISALFSNAASHKILSVFSWPSLEISRQMALLDVDIFAKIRPQECFNQNWQKDHRETRAPNIHALIERCNDVRFIIHSLSQ